MAGDKRNRLVGLSSSSGGAASFGYDPFGRRASKTVDGVTAQFQYDGARVIQEIQPVVGNVLTDMGFSRTDSTGNMTFLGDVLGSTLALTTDTGAVATQYSYEPFGVSTISGNTSTNPFQFAFHQNDGTGLYYYSARYYSPALARFISEDPSGTRGGINLYQYAGDRPVTLEDSTGLSPSDGNGSCRPCSATLRSRPIETPAWLGRLGEMHTDWDTKYGSDEQFVSGYPDNSYYIPFLNAGFNYDTGDGAIAWDSGSTTENCPKLAKLKDAASGWPNFRIPYNAVLGPNSNSAARYLGEVGGFNPNRPPGAWGWNWPIEMFFYGLD